MKTTILFLACAFLMAFNLKAQAPEKFNYQGIARDNTGTPLANQNLGVQISVLNPANTSLYVERHTVTTNDFGLYHVAIGDGTPVSGTMGGVNWAGGSKKIKVEIDPNGGTNYTDLGTTELLSVPYALYAAEAPNTGGPPTGAAGGDLNGNYPNPSIADDAVTTAKINDGTIATADLANDAVTTPKIDDMGATNGQVLKFDGTNWTPSPDAGESYNAGTGIAISGANEISANLGIDIATVEIQDDAVTSPKIADANVTTAKIADNAVTSIKINNGAVATSDLANDAVTAAKIAQMGATNGQVLKFDGTNWIPATDDPGAAGWGLGGNIAGNNDFIGTTNNEPLRFKQNNLPAGYIDGSITAFGQNALSSNTTGIENSAYGYASLNSNTTGDENSAFGKETLYSNTTGNRNSAFGEEALYSNATGFGNSAFGQNTLYSNTTGNRNSAFGNNALFYNTTGNWNSAFGLNSLYFNTTGSFNVAFGKSALLNNTTGNENTAIGNNALIDMDGLTASNNTGLGAQTDIADIALNATAIGYDAYAIVPSSIVLGGASVSFIGGYASWSNLSDARFKKEMTPLQHGLDFIMKLEPVTYHMNMQKLHNFMEQREGEAEEKDPEWLDEAMAKKAAIQYTGFSAQQVEKAAREIGYDFSGVHAPENKFDHYSLAYAEFVVPLVKAVQEQQQTIQNLQEANEALKKTLTEIRARLSALEQKD